MDKWNPFKEDYEDTNFNSYSRGPGRHLPQGNQNKQAGVQLYVTGIPIQLPPEGLRNLFLQTGSVKDVRIMDSKISGSQNTFGFVTMGNLKEATEAISKLNNFQIDRFRLRVQACQSQEERERRRRKREEDDAFLNTLNCAKNPQQDNSDEDLQISKSDYNGTHNNARAPNENLMIDIPNVSLSDLDDSIIKQGPPSLKIASSVPSSSNSSISDLTITVGNQSRQVKPNLAHKVKSSKVNGVGRGLISTDLSATEKSYRGMAQALNNNSHNPHSSLYERMTSYVIFQYRPSGVLDIVCLQLLKNFDIFDEPGDQYKPWYKYHHVIFNN
ncbi:hypothetical protein LOTGIDRAFT_159623 [Lottia gigantea]|uniref:RRM domain-containing protein n=1 Tax=Lottia gigantea TaxID=225164 RepID=V3ZZB7_LOTGI|nr:hypothetical protein LOTGIDRAFT_159623 [Lottia gigantea]ESO96873.1 hypothetical protein LOTGIDRAFT_159623 [Lottia gigantea]